jgi:hypothetical protein
MLFQNQIFGIYPARMEIQLMLSTYSHTTKVIGNNKINFPSFLCLVRHLSMNN